MKHPRIRSLLAGLALASAPLAVAAPAVAAPQPDKVTEHQAAITEIEQNNIEAYWTPERMAAAVPPSAGSGGERVSPEAAPVPQSANADPESPQPELGKVFFTLGGTDYVCSGTATESGNADVVTTAGHCLNEGPGEFATQFAFVPAYDNGDRPYGTWTARTLYTSAAWGNDGDFNHDIGFAVMNENDSGESLTDVVGSYPIAFNLERGLDYTSYGYPAGSPFDGESLYSCSGTASQDSRGSTDQGLTCDMTGGSSGGGWITGGQLNSVNSFKYTNDPSTMYGPYFGDVEQSVYQEAAAA